MENINILLVDDEEELIKKLEKLLQERLKNCDFCFTEANDGEEALAITSKKMFNLIICDYEMPKMNGGEFVTCMRKWGLQTPVILLTTLYLGQVYLKMGFDSFVHKSDIETSLLREVLKFTRL